MLDSVTHPADLLVRLRVRTRPLHAGLDRDLNLLGVIPDRPGMARVLARFHGLHAAAEPALTDALADEPFLAPRRRLPHVRQDLLALGMAPGAIDALPRAALPRLDRAGAALGLLYVLEGSTLGGLVIDKHLQGASWLPPLRYFYAHGKRTAALWREVCLRLQAEPDPAAQDAALDTAAATFSVLQAWLPAS